jgi:hypothetical protein
MSVLHDQEVELQPETSSIAEVALGAKREYVRMALVLKQAL